MEDIGGNLEEIHDWYTCSDLRASQFGWTTRDLPGIEIIQQRPKAGREQQKETGYKIGRTMALLGYHPLVAFPRSIWLYLKHLIALITVILTYILERMNYRTEF